MAEHLYALKAALVQGPYTIHSVHEWDFAFILPAQCTARGQDRFTNEYRRFNLDPQQSLPPSFQSDHHSFGWSAQPFISYELESRLTRYKTFALDMTANR